MDPLHMNLLKWIESGADAHYDNLEGLHVTPYPQCLNQPFW